MTPDAAEILALKALEWIAQEPDMLGIFAGSTGADPRQAQLDDPLFLAAVLDFLLMDDAWITGFCAVTGHPPADIARARAALPGGEAPHWT